METMDGEVPRLRDTDPYLKTLLAVPDPPTRQDYATKKVRIWSADRAPPIGFSQ